MKNTLDGGEAILEACRKLKIDYILSSPGTEWAPIWEAMADQLKNDTPGPVFMDCWHETLAVDIAVGYTLITGKMQAVLLHAGAGLLQGAMGIHGAWLADVPMLIMSGESMTYGEQPGFDPGAQWANNLSIVGGTTRLVEPIVKYAAQAGSSYTLYESMIRAAELSQRTPTGPTYLSVSTETLMEQWSPPIINRDVPPAPRNLSAPEDIQKLASLICDSSNPVIMAEAAGRETETFNALVTLSETAALPVVESRGALYANFPKDHPMHQGHDFKPFREETDLVIVIRTRTPWYPPSNRPPKAKIVVIDETPHRDNMVYQSLQADMYLEGNAAQTLRDLNEKLESQGIDNKIIAARRAKFTEAHDQLHEQIQAEQTTARKKESIDPIHLCAVLSEVMPEDTIYIDEVTTHKALIRRHIRWNQPQSLISRQGGLGQGLGLSLGIKLAAPERTVVTLIGDGAFLYNPVLQSFGAARDFSLPTLTIIFNNEKYGNMQGMLRTMYPSGTAVETDTYFGTHINSPDFKMITESFGGYGERVEAPNTLAAALRNGLEAVQNGQFAVLDVVLT